MKRKSTAALSVLLIILLLVSSCTRNNNAEVTGELATSLFEITFETQIKEPLCFATSDEELVVVGKADKGEIFTDEVLVYILNKGGILRSTSKIELPAPQLIQASDIDSHGNIWLFYNTNLDCFDVDGNYVESIELVGADANKNVNFASFDKLIVEDGYIYLLSSENLNEGNPLFAFDRIERTSSQTHLYNNKTIKDIFRLPDTRIVLKSYSPLTFSYSFEEFDAYDSKLSSWELSASNVRDGMSDALFSAGFGNYPLLRHTGDGIFGYDIETGENTPLVNWFDYDIYSAVSGYAAAFDDDHIFVLVRNSENAANLDLVRLAITNASVTPAQSAESRKVLTAAGFFLFDDMKSQINIFNRTNTKYRIEVKDYFEGDFDAGLQKFNLDILSGKIPDIILLNDFYPLPRDSYASHGLFADLYELMENDPDVDKDEFLPNIIKALEIDGKLYFGATSFYVRTLVGKTSVVGAEMGWMWGDYFALVDRQPQGTIPFAGGEGLLPRESMLRSLLNSKLSDYIDTNNKTCDFVASDFPELLKTAAGFDEYPSGDIANSAYSAGNPLLLQADVFSFFELKRWEEQYFKEDVTFIGFPSSDGQTTGAYAMLYNTFALSSKSDNLDGAWEFAKFLLKDCQEKSGLLVQLPDGSYDSGFSGFPLKTSELLRLAEDSRYKRSESPMDLDENGNLPMLPYNTDEEIRKTLDLIFSVTKLSKNEQYVYDIILEEADWFFAGQKTVGQVAEIIQSRVSLYLAELR